MARRASIGSLEELHSELPLDLQRHRLHRLTIRNFRCIGPSPVNIELDDIVVLVGPNNAGKTSILRAYEVVMQHGSKAGELTLEDFPNAQVDSQNLPQIELETVVFDVKTPGDRWVRRDQKTGAMFVRELWIWQQPGQPKKVGWDVDANDWHASEGPWGAANVARSGRPEPVRVEAFASPDDQARNVIELLRKALLEHAKELDSEDVNSPYAKLLLQIREVQTAIVKETRAQIEHIEQRVSNIIGEVFPGYVVRFDAQPDIDVDRCISFFKSEAHLRIGPAEGGHQSPIQYQGSGARRTLLWAALRILSEHHRSSKANASKANTSALERPHLLLIDEPELCLHPSAVREACRVLYDLPQVGNWQVMVTTHCPIFVDLGRKNTSVVRVERREDGRVGGTTIFRPTRAEIDDNDREQLKLLNICDPYVAEFFFGGKTIVVEGDTEYAAFRYLLGSDPKRYGTVHIVRARGKYPIVSLCKILNHFGSAYAVLHDSDEPTITSKKTGKAGKNGAWSANEKILTAVKAAPEGTKVRLVAALTNFEVAFLGESPSRGEKPYFALQRLIQDEETRKTVGALLDALVDHTKPLPHGAIEWSSLEGLQSGVSGRNPRQTTFPLL